MKQKYNYKTYNLRDKQLKNKMMERFEYFDSFRGILCISVIVFHQGLEAFTFNGFNFGVMGFFILSSFLLSFRLIKQYESATSVDKIIQITINYAIIRLFRIYFPYLIFCSFEKYYLNEKSVIKENDTMFDLIILKHWNRTTHLWTMPVEIRYYFLIPFIAILFSRIHNVRLIGWIIFLINLIFLVSIRRFGLFRILENHELTRFDRYLPVFMAGSTLALLYFNLERTKIIEKLTKFKVYNYILTLISLILFILITRSHAWYKTYKDDAYVYSAGIALFMLLLLVSPSNYVAQYLSNDLILKIFGKFSYGTYLFHINVQKNQSKFPFRRYLTVTTDFTAVNLLISLFFGVLFYYSVENNLMIVSKYVTKWINGKLLKYKKVNQIEI